MSRLRVSKRPELFNEGERNSPLHKLINLQGRFPSALNMIIHKKSFADIT